MQLDANKENICINQLVGQKNDMVEVEGDVIVNDIKPDILSTISVNGNVCIYKKEVLDGKIKLDGAVNVYIMYLSDDENGGVRSLNTSVDFTKTLEFDGCSSGMDIDEMLNIKNIECKVINSRKVNVRAFLDLSVKVYSNDNVEIINDVNSIDGIQVLNNSLEINSLIGRGSTRAFAKDTITIDNVDNLAEILNSDISIINKDVKMSYNKILAKADLEVKIMYLTEDNRIKTITNDIPVMGFVDMPNVSDTNICNTKCKLKNVILKPNSVEEHSINVEIEVEINCYVYEPKRINVIQDLYSPTSNVQFSKRNITALVNTGNMNEMCNIQEQLSIPEIESNQIYDVQVRANLQKEDITNGRVTFEGEVELEFLYESNTSSRLESKIMKMPFNHSINNDNINESTTLDTNIEIRTQNFVVLNDGNVEAKVELQFELMISKNEKINVIDNIEVDDKKECNQYSMVIYFVKPKDTLWEIAKKFDSTIEEIARVNEIEDVNKIMPGMQLFIPRYCNRKTA